LLLLKLDRLQAYLKADRSALVAACVLRRKRETRRPQISRAARQSTGAGRGFTPQRLYVSIAAALRERTAPRKNIPARPCGKSSRTP